MATKIKGLSFFPLNTNFFENRVVDYAKGALTGDWADVWGRAAEDFALTPPKAQ